MATPPLTRTEKHLFRFFIDGSLRTYFLATGVEGTRTFPIELAQIGASVVQRNEKGNLSILSNSHEILLLVPKGARIRHCLGLDWREFYLLYSMVGDSGLEPLTPCV